MFEKTFGDERFLQSELARQDRKTELKKLEIVKLQNQLQDVQTQVAKNGGEWAGSMRLPASESQIDLSGVEFQAANKAFKEHDYVKAKKLFHKYIENFPVGEQIVQAHFMLAESLFRSSDLEGCLEVVDIMISQYPENELTGFIMLRMGQIFQVRNRSEEAIEIYEIVNDKFRASKSLAEQSQALLRSVQKL